MRYSRLLAMALLPICALLASCKTMNSPTESQGTTVMPAQQVINVQIYPASDKKVNNYKKVSLSDQETIYVAPKAVVTRVDVIGIDSVQDRNGRVFVRLQLNEMGVQAFKALPEERGFLTFIGGELASLTGVLHQENQFLFLVRNEEAAKTIIRLISGQ